MKIQVTITLNESDSDGDEVTVATVWMRCAPRVGEFLWLTLDRDRIKKEFGTTSFEVKTVAHWVGDTVDRQEHPPIHNICVYVEPVLNAPT